LSTLLTKNLALRVATAVVALPALLLAFFLAPRWVGVALIAAACAVALHEFFELLRARQIEPLVLPGVAILGLAFLDATRLVGPPLWPAALVAAVTAALTRAGTMGESLTAAALTALGAAYAGTLGGCMAALLLLPPAADGAWRIVFLMAVVMASDTAAYFAGRLFGRRKLAPVVSPGKTVEGAVGALLGGTLAALGVRALGLPGLPLSHAVALGAAVTVVGIVGDLAESLMKRWAGVKDSGTFFPGHGGMLDRVDSLLFGAPVLYYYYALIYH
jgi:phosphatidate cytidylyltransferase